MSDFMREVDEEYRRERVVRFLSRYQIPLVLALVAIVVGSGVWRWTVDRRTAAAEADNSRYQAAEKLARAGDSAVAIKSFDALAADGVAGYPLLARMRAAAELAGSDPGKAAEAFDVIASGEGGSQALRDTARYRAALLRVDREDPKTFEERYGRFALDSFTFHDGMRELLALDALKRNDGTAAEHYLTEIIIDGAAPGALRNRAQAFLDLARSGPATTEAKAAPPATVTPFGGTPGAAASPAVPAGQAAETAPAETAPAESGAMSSATAPPAPNPAPATPKPAPTPAPH